MPLQHDPAELRCEAEPRRATARAVIWGPRAPQEALAELMRARNLLPEHVESAPAAVLAGMRADPAPAALVLVNPGALCRAAEVLEVYRTHLPGVGCWSFRPAGPGQAGEEGSSPGVLEPLECPSELARVGAPPVASHPADPASPRATRGPSSQAGAGGQPLGAGRCGSARLTRAELAMLLGPTRTLQSPAGDAG